MRQRSKGGLFAKRNPRKRSTAIWKSEEICVRSLRSGGKRGFGSNRRQRTLSIIVSLDQDREGFQQCLSFALFHQPFHGSDHLVILFLGLNGLTRTRFAKRAYFVRSTVSVALMSSKLLFRILCEPLLSGRAGRSSSLFGLLHLQRYWDLPHVSGNHFRHFQAPAYARGILRHWHRLGLCRRLVSGLW